jgi:hypothetical protein
LLGEFKVPVLELRKIPWIVITLLSSFLLGLKIGDFFSGGLIDDPILRKDFELYE